MFNFKLNKKSNQNKAAKNVLAAFILDAKLFRLRFD